MYLKISILFLGFLFLASCQNEESSSAAEATPETMDQTADGQNADMNSDGSAANQTEDRASLSTSADQANATSTTPQAPDGPTTTMQFDSELHDFGTIGDGDKVTHTFVFTNTGDKPLVVSNAKGSCGCTVPNWDKDPVMPGETGELTIQYDSKNKGSVDGKVDTKFVTVTANTVPSTQRLTIRANVVKEAG